MQRQPDVPGRYNCQPRRTLVRSWRRYMFRGSFAPARTFALALAGTVALIASACDNSKPSNGTSTKAPATDSTPPAVAEIGNPLYADMPVPPNLNQKAPVTNLSTDPIVVRQAHVSLPQTQNVPSKN